MRQMLKECKAASGHIAMWPYLVSNDNDMISVLNTAILEPGISSIDS